MNPNPFLEGLTKGNKKRKFTAQSASTFSDNDNDGDFLGDEEIFPDMGDEEEKKPIVSKKPCMLPFYERDEERRKKREEEEHYDRDSDTCELCRVSNTCNGNNSDMPEMLKAVYDIFNKQFMRVKEEKIYEMMAQRYNSTIVDYDKKLNRSNPTLKRLKSSEVRVHMESHDVDMHVSLMRRFNFLEKSAKYIEDNGMWERIVVDGIPQMNTPLELNPRNCMLHNRICKQQMEMMKLIQQIKLQDHALSKSSSSQSSNSFFGKQV